MTSPKKQAASRKRTAEHEVVYRKGRPAAVIIDIRTLQRMHERLEDWEDVRFLKALRKKPRQFISLEDYFAMRVAK